MSSVVFISSGIPLYVAYTKKGKIYVRKNDKEHSEPFGIEAKFMTEKYHSQFMMNLLPIKEETI